MLCFVCFLFFLCGRTKNKCVGVWEKYNKADETPLHVVSTHAKWAKYMQALIDNGVVTKDGLMVQKSGEVKTILRKYKL